VIGSSQVRAFGGDKTGVSPVDRSRSGSKHGVIACGRGAPLAAALSGGDRNDIGEMVPLVDAIPPGARPPRSTAAAAAQAFTATVPTRHASSGARCVAATSKRRSPRPSAGTAPGSAASGGWWSAQFAWLHQFRRLRLRYERRADIHEAFLAIGCSLSCLKLLQPDTSLC
jgi:hypothetical protein